MSDLFVKLDARQVSEQVELVVRAAIAEQIGRDPDALVKAVVETALASRGSSGYGTVASTFKQELDKQIREAAIDLAKSILLEQRPRIEAELRRRITAELLTDAVLKQTIDKMGDIWLTIGIPPAEATVDG